MSRRKGRATSAAERTKILPSTQMQEFGADDAFRSIRYNRNTQLENQKLALSLLEATEAKLDFVAENYFMALWPLLDNEDKENAGSMGKGQACDFNTSVIYLASFVAPQLQTEFIQREYSLIYAKLAGALERFVSVAPFVRSAIAVLQAVLCAFDAAAWEDKESLKELLSHLLQLAVDPRPKVRKLAQDSVLSFCRCDAFVSGDHPAKGDVLNFLTGLLQRASRKESVDALHIIPLLRSMAPHMTHEEVSALTVPLLNSAGLGNNHLTIAVYNFVALLGDMCLGSRPEIVTADCSRIIMKFIQQQRPDVTVSDLIPAWLNVYCKILRVNSLLDNAADLTVNFSLILEYLVSTETTVLQSIEEGLCLVYCLVTVESLGTVICQDLGKWIHMKNAVVAPYVIRSIGDFCRESGVDVLQCSKELLKLLAEMHDSKQAKHASLIEKTIGQYFSRYGPEAILEIIPLNLDGHAAPRAWLLPVLKDNVSHANLEYFKSNLIPLATKLDAKCEQYKKSGKLNDAKVYQVIVHQIWATLSAFMTFPKDFAAVIDALAPVLGQQLNCNPLLRPVIANAITSFIRRGQSLENDVDNVAGEELCILAASDIQKLASFSGNFLPILFNIYGTTEPEQRGYLLTCIEVFLGITPIEAIRHYFERIVSRLQSQSGNPDELISLLEISSVLVVRLDVTKDYAELMSVILPLMSSPDISVQKRAYRVVGDLLSREDYTVDLEQLEKALIAAYETHTIDSAVKKVRFRVLLKLTSQLSDDSLYIIPLFLPETVLGTKEVNQQARLLAFELLLAFARRMSRGGMIVAEKTGGMLPNDTTATLDEFMTMLVAGLAGSTPHMISASIMAIARVLFEMRSSINAELLSVLFGDIISILHSPSREVVKSALGFIKVTLASVHKTEDGIDLLDGHLGELINGLLTWSNEHHQQFKVRVRHLMERLVRRFGFERIWGLTPVAHQKLLTNIRKRRERLKRQKQQGGATEDAAEPEYDGDKFDSMTNISMITKAGAAGIRASSKFESALNDSDSELDDSDEDEIPADSILHDLANVENDDEIETILSRKLSLATSLSRSAPSKKRAVREESSDDENVRLDDDGKMMISEDDTEEEDDDEDDRDVPVAGKKQVRFASEAKPLQKRAKKQRGDAKRREDKFEPFSYLPMTRATKKNSSQAKAKAGVGASGKKTPKYYMKRA